MAAAGDVVVVVDVRVVLVADVVASVISLLSRDLVGIGAITLICSIILTKIEEEVMVDDRIASSNDGVRIVNQLIFFFVAKITARSAVNSASDVTFIISKIAETALMDVCSNKVFNWNLIPIPISSLIRPHNLHHLTCLE